MKYPVASLLRSANFGHMAHTDVGSLTLLFASSTGLEVLVGDDEWVSVPPRERCIIVNVGDTLSFLSGMLFRSCIHRVVPPQLGGYWDQEQARFSVAFFKRPELDSTFRDGAGRSWRGEEWHMVKYNVFRKGNDVQHETSLLTGRQGFLGHTNTNVATTASTL